MKNYKQLLYISVVFLLAGCTFPPLKDDVEVASDYTYIIGPGDSFQIFVWGNPDVSTSVSVRPDGKVTIPLVEDIYASGKTPTELARILEQELATFIREPQVVVIMNSFRGIYEQQVRVIGQLSGGGGGGGGSRYSARSLPYQKGMTLLDLIITMGGIGTFADGNRASIVRNIDGQNMQFGIRMDDLVEDADLTANVKILPGDILIIPEAYF